MNIVKKIAVALFGAKKQHVVPAARVVSDSEVEAAYRFSENLRKKYGDFRIY